MAVAYFQFHQPGGLWPIQNHGEPAVLFCFIFLLLAGHGGGPWSLDALLWKKCCGSRAPAAPSSGAAARNP
jgi:putative oxidoreductase